MAHKKQGGKARQHVRPSGKRLGVKVSHLEKVGSGEVLVRQRGTKVAAGKNVKVGRDQTLYATASGEIKFTKKQGKKVLSVVTK